MKIGPSYQTIMNRKNIQHLVIGRNIVALNIGDRILTHRFVNVPIIRNIVMNLV